MRRPLNSYRISQLWGGNPSYYQAAFGIPYHNGTDYVQHLHAPVHSIADGLVVYAGFDARGYGQYARVWHPHLMLHSFYAHLDEFVHETPPDMGHGIPIREGDVIGLLGNTGNSTGPHLHFELRLGLDAHKYDVSPYQGIARGRINPETFFVILERALVSEAEDERTSEVDGNVLQEPSTTTAPSTGVGRGADADSVVEGE